MRTHMAHAVTLAITPFAKIHCRFWLEDDVWTGIAEQVGITIHAASFEQAKNDMELQLGLFVEDLIRRSTQQASGSAA